MYLKMTIKAYIKVKKSKTSKNTSTNKTHLLLYLLGLIILITKINGKSSSPDMEENTVEKMQQLESIHSLLLLKKLTTKNIKFNQNQIQNAVIILLLLLSNDVHPNPGPNPQDLKKYVGTSLKCCTCNKWTVISENKVKNIKDCGFEWICTSLACKPNHHSFSHHTLITSPNRYSILNSTEYCNHNAQILPSTGKKAHKSQEPISETIHTVEDNTLLKELTKISSKDFIGKDLCRRCHKEVKTHHRAVLCDLCDNWIHLNCSDMKPNIYNINKRKIHFKWTCNICRVSEEKPSSAKFNSNKCSPDKLPESWDDLRKLVNGNEEIIIHLNARSVVEKGDYILELCTKLKPALVFLTETWLDESCPKGTAVPKGYTIIRKDRSEEFKQLYGKTNGGGVAVLVREGINMKKHTTLNKDENEILWCTLTIKGKRYLTGLIYRAEYTTLLNMDNEGNTEIENLLQATHDYNLLLIGDTNCDTLTLNPSKSTQTLIKVTEDYGLNQHILKPTRFNEKTATTIDHIFTRNDHLIKKSGTCEGISDHCGIYCILNKMTEMNQEESVRCRSLKNFDKDQFRKDIKQRIDDSNYKEHITNKSLNDAFNTWLEVIKTVSDEHAPWKEFKRGSENKHIPWYNRELINTTDRKNSYLQLYRLYRNPDYLNLYKIFKNKQTHMKRALKRNYYKEKIENFEGDSKKIWSILKEVTNLDYREEIQPDIINKDTANKFNKFFANVGIEVQKKLGIQIKAPNLTESGIFKFKLETDERIDYLIKRIRPDVATGYDQISSRLLKAAAPAILTHLKEMINLSYETKIYPDALKRANVKALHKKGEYNNPAQYRPISILTTISKVFERSATEQVMDFYIEQKKLSSQQHAYRRYHSTNTCLFELTETALKYIDEGYLVAIASLDLSKAFDSLSHELILQKLLDMELDGTAVQWVKSYLENRKQVVKFGNIISDEESVESGVPQGSILGPLLFITCTNDIEKEMEGYDIFSYADDMQILVKGTNIKELERKLEVAIKKANSYYNKNSLLNNATKTEIMLLGSKQKLNKLRRLQVKVTEEGKEKYLYGEESLKILGLHIDQSLTWDKHISHIKKKATNSIRNLHRANKLLPMKQKRVLYDSLITPHFTYGDILWNRCGTINSNKLQQSQNYAAKSMLGVSRYSSSKEALKKLELLPLAQKRDIHTAVFVKKAMEGKVPSEIHMKYINQQRPSNLRQGSFQIPRHRTKLYETGTYYTSIKIWNTLPQKIKENNLASFKHMLQKQKLEKYTSP